MSGPDRGRRSADGTPIAVFESGAAEPGTRPLVLVHGTTADHRTFRVVGPMLGRRRRLYALDRRGRGASGDGAAYAIEREFEDLAAVADALAAEAGGPVDVVGHSYGGRCALGASLLTPSIRRIVCYEGAPAPADRPYQPADLAGRLRAHLDRGDPEAALETFMREVVGMDDAGDGPLPRGSRVAAPGRGGVHDPPRARRRALARRRRSRPSARSGVPVLQVLGTASRAGLPRRDRRPRYAPRPGFRRPHRGRRPRGPPHPSGGLRRRRRGLPRRTGRRRAIRSGGARHDDHRRARPARRPFPRSGDPPNRAGLTTRPAGPSTRMLDHRPAVIVQPLDTADVVAAVRWAAEADLPISIRGGGHSVAGHSVGDGSLMLDLARTAGRRASMPAPASPASRAGRSSLTSTGDRPRTASPRRPGRTRTPASAGSSSAAGSASSSRRAGLACDALVGAELVTADGTVVDVDAERDPELLWALRGGGGNFGVVTEVRLALEPLPRRLPRTDELPRLGRARARGARLFELDAEAPDELSTQGVLANDPTEGPVITLIGAWLGDPAPGAAAIAPFGRRADLRRPTTPGADLVPRPPAAASSGWARPTATTGRASSWAGPTTASSTAIDGAHAAQPRSTSFVLIEAAARAGPSDPGGARRRSAPGPQWRTSRPSRSGRTRPTTRRRSPGPGRAPPAGSPSRSRAAAT